MIEHFVIGVHYLETLQQEEVLSELYSYSHQTPAPRDSVSAKLTLHYLEACNKLFERGLLSHDKVTSSTCQVIVNIEEGYQFFTKWLDEIYEKGTHVYYSCVTCILVCIHACACLCACMHVMCICLCIHIHVHVYLCMLYSI